MMSFAMSHDYAEVMAASTGPTWQKLYDAFSYLSHLNLLKRLVDDRNPETDSKPRPDGSNLSHPDLKVSWALHRQFLRTLHYRSLYWEDQAPGLMELYQINYISLLLFHTELQAIPLQDRAKHVRNEFQRIWTSYNDLEERLQAVANALFVEERINPKQYTIAQTVEHNINDPNTFDRYVNQVCFLSQPLALN
jgi:hypothetical protein